VECSIVILTENAPNYVCRPGSAMTAGELTAFPDPLRGLGRGKKGERRSKEGGEEGSVHPHFLD